ncbi:MAG TPA: tRNA (adenine(22)-N(1))-methyltransferase TrmK [Calditrichia bacterium]|nr:tRNA (adenine(22)-N(1))-methyltransferase TrmK [Calditrichota bacterium]HQV31683.1 tRNA (adenine(22)-N(1))-methyltransferase TrmK [Calditrichia bacterium]
MTRLEKILDFIPDSARTVADVGYDHGFLIEKLVTGLPPRRVIGIEIQEGLDQRFWSRSRLPRRDFEPLIDFRRGDGLQPLVPGEADCIVMAGIGEGTIRRIIEAGRGAMQGSETLVLVPSHPPTGLFHDLYAMGWAITREDIHLEKGYFYHLSTLCSISSLPAGKVRPQFVGETLPENHPLLKPYAAYIKKRMIRAFRNAHRQPPLRKALIVYLNRILGKPPLDDLLPE